MKIADIVRFLEGLAHPSLQESYDNAGLLTGDPGWDCTGVLCCLDVTESVIREAADRGCNLVVAHHPLIFKGLKRITGRNYVERTVIDAIKKDIAIYAIHTNLDNVLSGVSGRMAEVLGLSDVQVLSPKPGTLLKLFTFVPRAQADAVRQALFEAGAGEIGRYGECSFNTDGTGTFKAGEGTNPFVGEKNQQHQEAEVRIEVVLPQYKQAAVVSALQSAHPYEEVAYDLVPLVNAQPGLGAGVTGYLPKPLETGDFLALLKEKFGLQVVRHTPPAGKPIRKVALCGGAGSFLVSSALAAQTDAYVTGDMKYHEFFDADGRILIADIGHFESEQFTIDLLAEHLAEKFTTFAVLKTGIITNPVRYYL
ncbi:Nif3-like dinuclear metal center hexameric protein [Nostoc ellipsosporum NOK]|nr:Nif3-like dinuclear metal center hexameric protein [Nostoc ellipsosporum NOK]